MTTDPKLEAARRRGKSWMADLFRAFKTKQGDPPCPKCSGRGFDIYHGHKVCPHDDRS